jgi:enterochelin esterase-like enzyme
MPWVDASYRTIPDRDHRALSGKSAGGYVAIEYRYPLALAWLCQRIARAVGAAE